MSTWSTLLSKQKTYEITKLLPETEYTVSINGTYNEPIEVWLTTLVKDENRIAETEVNQNNAFYVGNLEGNKLTFTAQESHTALVIRTLGDLELTTIQLEKGNTHADWTPAPEDVQAGIDKSIKSTQVEYYLSTSSTVLAGGSWSTTAPTWVDGEYMWSRTKVTLNDGTTSYTPNENGTCIAGATGATGNGIKSTEVTYQAHTDGTEIPKGTWGSSIPEVQPNQFLWTRTDITYTDLSVTTSYSVGKMGDRGPAGPVLRIEAPDGLTFSKNQTKSIRLEVKLMDEDINRIDEYAAKEIRWERSSSDSIGDILFASIKQGPSIFINPEFLNVPATYTCFISKILSDINLTIDGDDLTDDQSGVITVETYSPVVYTAHVTTSLEISEEIKKIEKTLENVERNSVTTSEFERERNRIFGSVSEVITTTADLVTRVDGVKTEVERQALKQEALTSELDMTSRRIRGEVKAVSDKGDRQFSYLELRADSIQFGVEKMSADMSHMSSQITLTAEEISSKVSKDDVVSAINQRAGSITIDANKINLTGYVTVSSLSGQGTTTIDGSNIKTGTISANRLNLTGYATNSNLTTEINSAKSYADTKANTAQSNAKTYTDTQIVAIDGVLKNYTDSEITAFSGGLGDLAFKDKIGTALLDNTIIDGGYIKTNLISFNNAVGTNVNLTGKITATSGKIGNFDISSNNLVGTSVSLKPNEIIIGQASLQSHSTLGHVLLKGFGLAIGSGKNDGFGSWITLERNLNQVSVANYGAGGIFINGDILYPATVGTNSHIGSASSRYGNIYLVNQPNVASDTRYKSDIQDIDPLLVEIIGREVKPKQYRTQFDDKIHFGYVAQDVERALYKYCGNDKDKYAMLSKDESYMSLLYGELNVIIEAYNRLQNEKLEERIAVLERESDDNEK